MIFITVLSALVFSTVLNLMSMAATGRLVRAQLEEVKLFSGPRLKRIKFRNAVLDLHAIPFGGYVKFANDLQDVHPLKQLFITTFGALTLLALSIALLGHPEGFEQFFNGFYQIIIGALAPSSTGAQLLRSSYEFLTVNTFFTCLGAVASKMAMANLLPIPILNGGDAILIVANWVRPMSSEVRERIRLFGGLILLLLLACWLAAFYFVLRSV